MSTQSHGNEYDFSFITNEQTSSFIGSLCFYLERSFIVLFNRFLWFFFGDLAGKLGNSLDFLGFASSFLGVHCFSGCFLIFLCLS